MLLALMLLALVNDYRAVEAGLPPLLPSAHLTEAAQYHAENMTFLTHEDPLGRGPYERMGDYGFTGRRGEVLAVGTHCPSRILDVWRNSPGHNSVILDSEFTVAGVGTKDRYWVMDLGGCRSCPKAYPQWRW